MRLNSFVTLWSEGGSSRKNRSRSTSDIDCYSSNKNDDDDDDYHHSCQKQDVVSGRQQRKRRSFGVIRKMRSKSICSTSSDPLDVAKHSGSFQLEPDDELSGHLKHLTKYEIPEEPIAAATVAASAVATSTSLSDSVGTPQLEKEEEQQQQVSSRSISTSIQQQQQQPSSSLPKRHIVCHEEDSVVDDDEHEEAMDELNLWLREHPQKDDSIPVDGTGTGSSSIVQSSSSCNESIASQSSRVSMDGHISKSPTAAAAAARQVLDDYDTKDGIDDTATSPLPTLLFPNKPSSYCSASVTTRPTSILKNTTVTTRQKSSLPANEEEEVVSEKKQKKNVKFSTLMFHEHEVILGDNPAVTRGVPVMIDWTAFHSHQVNVDDFERNRPLRRFKFELKMESLDRLRLLKRNGYSLLEIKEGIKDANVARSKRQRTRELLHFTPIIYAWERFQRSVTHQTILRSQKHQERKYLQPYLSTTVASASGTTKGKKQGKKGAKQWKQKRLSSDNFHPDDSTNHTLSTEQDSVLDESHRIQHITKLSPRQQHLHRPIYLNAMQ